MTHIIKYICLFLAGFMIFDITMDIRHQQTHNLLLLKQFGVLFISIDLWVFLTKTSQPRVGLQDYFMQYKLNLPPIVKFTNRLGHVGFMLIICSWFLSMSS